MRGTKGFGVLEGLLLLGFPEDRLSVSGSITPPALEVRATRPVCDKDRKRPAETKRHGEAGCGEGRGGQDDGGEVARQDE